MSALLPSTLSDKVKMQEAQRVANEFAAQALEKEDQDPIPMIHAAMVVRGSGPIGPSSYS